MKKLFLEALPLITAGAVVLALLICILVEIIFKVNL